MEAESYLRTLSIDINKTSEVTKSNLYDLDFEFSHFRFFIYCRLQTAWNLFNLIQRIYGKTIKAIYAEYAFIGETNDTHDNFKMTHDEFHYKFCCIELNTRFDLNELMNIVFSHRSR